MGLRDITCPLKVAIIVPTMQNGKVPDKRAYIRAFERLTKIHKQIASKNFPSLQKLAAPAEVTERTIKRDLAILRDNFSAPLKYSRKKNGYYYTDIGWNLPLQKITEGDLLSFFIAENALKLTGHTSEALQLKHSLAKIASLLPEEMMVNLATLGENIAFQNLPFVTVEPALLKLLAIAAISQQTIEFDYYSPHNQQKTHRTADVYLLHNFAGDWYAVSFDHTRQDFRDFHIGRMSNVEETNNYFKKRRGWDPEDYLKKGFFMMRGGRLTTVVIHFDSYQAQWIRERNYFHPEEKREELPDKSLRLSFKIGEQGLAAVARFCLQYAGNCRVEKPAKLKEIVRDKLKRGLKLQK